MNKEYNDNDYELLYLISENTEEAKNKIYEKYKPIIEMKTKKYTKFVEARGYDYNDLYQEGMIGLARAMADFSSQKDTQFITFANVCIDRQIYTFLRNIDSGKHKLLNDSVSMDTTTNTYGRSLNEILDDKNLNPETSFLESEETKELYDKIYNILTSREKEVFELKSQGFSYREIAQLLNITEKAASKAIEKIRRKASKLLNGDKTTN